jgi:hypothetical protein
MQRINQHNSVGGADLRYMRPEPIQSLLFCTHSNYFNSYGYQRPPLWLIRLIKSKTEMETELLEVTCFNRVD